MSYYCVVHDCDYLEHHSIKGQKWGIRKYQNEDGTLTPAAYNSDFLGNFIINSQDVSADFIHSGIPGMKWGVRRYQNKDGTLTEEGKIRYRQLWLSSNSDGTLTDKGRKKYNVTGNQRSEAERKDYDFAINAQHRIADLKKNDAAAQAKLEKLIERAKKRGYSVTEKDIYRISVKGKKLATGILLGAGSIGGTVYSNYTAKVANDIVQKTTGISALGVGASLVLGTLANATAQKALSSLTKKDPTDTTPWSYKVFDKQKIGTKYEVSADKKT